MPDGPHAVLDPFAGRRTMLVCLHILLSVAAALALLSREHFRVTSSLLNGIGSTSTVAAALPAFWPYIVSLVMTWEVVPRRRAYVTIYMGLLLGSTLVGVWILLTVPYADLLSSVIILSVAQAAAYVLVARYIAHFDDMHRDV